MNEISTLIYNMKKNEQLLQELGSFCLANCFVFEPSEEGLCAFFGVDGSGAISKELSDYLLALEKKMENKNG